MAQKITLKLRKILFLRVILLAALAVFTVIVSAIILEHFLIKNALSKEAQYFWDRYELNSNAVPPDTWNLKTLLVDGEKRVGSLGGVSIDLFEDVSSSFVHVSNQPGFTLMYRSENDGKNLYLLFNGENVRKLAFFLGIIPLTMFLLLSYIVGFLFYRRAAKTLSPIMWLADKFEQFDPLSSDLPEFNLLEMPLDADWETRVLANSLDDYLERIKSFVSRERAFTRDVSHELRTPLTVMGMALNILDVDGDLNEKDAKAVQRIRRASTDMKELVDVFLILARESSQEMEESRVWVAEVAQCEIDKARNLLQDKSVGIHVHKDYELVLDTSEKILEVLLGNLIRNAMIYTEKGSIDIVVSENTVVIKDTGIGMSEEQITQIYEPFFRGGKRPSGGYGVGLTIVKRIADRFDWRVGIESQLDEGTQVTVTF